MINSFEVVTNRRIIYGENKIDEIAGILKWYGKKKVFFSTFSTEAEQFKRITASLDNAGIEYVVYDKVISEPDLHMINGGRDLFLAEGCDCTRHLEAVLLSMLQKPSVCYPSMAALLKNIR